MAKAAAEKAQAMERQDPDISRDVLREAMKLLPAFAVIEVVILLADAIPGIEARARAAAASEVYGALWIAKR